MNSFITLSRAGAAPSDTRFTPGNLGAGDPFVAQRLIAWSGPDSMSVGRVTWSGSLTQAGFPHTELIIVEKGALILDDSGTSLRIAAGEAAVIGRGSAVRIHAENEASWIFCAVSAAVPAPMLQRVNLAAELAPSPPPAADVLLSAEPQCRQNPECSDKPGRTRIGIWDSTPYTRKQVPHRVNELMYILEGSVTLTDGSGHAGVFGRGDCVFVPHQTPCSWHSTVPVRKLYCVQDFES
ncbi:MAG: cupin domain-containing protein [Proteobacteria bacterium]|nr:cupin domain-containing protein [Pseudomonadota bacterium]